MPSKRRKGAQPGNTNAIKQGWYSSRFTPTELADLEMLLTTTGLDDEIHLFRVNLRRLWYKANGEDESKQDLSDTLNDTGLGIVRLASVMRTNEAFTRRQTDVAGLLAEAIQEVFGSGLDPRNP
jgi:hypothetical protein